MKERVRRIIVGLTVIFILGILMHAFSLAPGHRNGGQPLFGVILLGLHALVALGLLIVATVILVFSLRSQDETRKRAGIFGFISIALAFLGGLAVVILKGPVSNIGMFFMELGFLTAFITYGRYFYLLKK